MFTALVPRSRSAFVCIFSLLATADLARAATINVGPGQPYPTIQSGINAANNGDTVLVAPGTYNENINFNGKAITVTSSGGAAGTIIDGGSIAPAVSFASGESSTSVISGFTIQHGGSYTGTPGGVYSYNSTPTILNNTITLSNCWGINSQYSAPLIQNNTISATQSPILGCGFGGGAAIIVSGGIGGLYNTPGVNSGVITGNTIENNVESGLADAGGNGGAAVAVWGGSPVIINNIMRNNASPGGSGGAINFVNSPGAVIAQNLIYGNSAGCGGGAIATDGRGLFVANNTIVNNVNSGNYGFSECANIAQIYPDPLSYGMDSPSDVFINNIISGSTSYPSVNCSWFQTPSLSIQPTFENNILYNAGGPFFGSYCVDVTGQDGNVAADPQFVNAAADDYHLQSTSPAIDSGQNSALQTFQTTTGMNWAKDFGGNPRIQNGSGKGCIIDMGAYEYQSTTNDCGVTETLTSSLNPATAGQSVTFTAQLSATSGIPTGSIQFFDGATLLSTQAVSNTGSASFSTSSLTVGSHTITANYQPTGTFSPATATLTEVINGITTGTTLSCAPNPINISNTAQLVATVTSGSGTPTGAISFTDNGSGLATQNLVNGTTTLIYSGTSAGTYVITATYIPAGSFAASSATCSEVVNPLPTTSTLAVAPNPSTYGSAVTLTAAVSPVTLPGPSTPTGAVTFYDGATVVGSSSLAGGVATLITSSLPGGNYSLTCTYGGSLIYASSNCNPIPVVVNAAPTSLTLSSGANPATYLSGVTFTVHLTAAGQSAGVGNTIVLGINGQNVSLTTDATASATFTISTLPPGSYPVTASFASTNNFLGSSALLTETIAAAPTSTGLLGVPNPGDVNQTVTLGAVVSVLPVTANIPVTSGSITFYNGSTALGTSQVSANGTANLTTSFAAVGAYNITAVYTGDVDFATSTSAPLTETIVAGDFSISATPTAASIYTGQSTAAQVNVSSLLGFDQPLAFSCSGLPANATCTFSPATLPNGQGAVNVVIQTEAPHQVAAASIFGALTLFLLAGWRRRRGLLAALGAVLLTIGLGVGIAGCASPNPIAGGTAPGTYQVAVTATTTGNGTGPTHSAVVTLTVKSLF
jgi:hypothetical protein